MDLSWEGDPNAGGGRPGPCPGTWSVYACPKDDPSKKKLVASDIPGTSLKASVDVDDYFTDYIYDVAFIPYNAPLLDRLIVSTEINTDASFAIKTESVTGYENSINLSWQAEPYKGQLPFTYNIFRQSTVDEEWEQIGTKTLNNQNDVKFSFVDNKDLTACNGYRYKIQATLFDGYLATSDTTEIVQLDGSSKVTAITTTKGDYQGMVKVTWDAVQIGSEPTEYELMRRVKGSSTWASLYKVSGTNTFYSYEDNTAMPGVYYDYRVVSKTDCGSSITEINKDDVGFSRATGIVSGRITYGTGTAVQDARVSLIKNSENASEAAQFYAVSTQEAGDGIFLDLDGKVLNEKFNNKDFSVQMFVRPNAVQNGSTPVFFDLGNQLSLRLGAYNDDAAGYELLLAQGETTEATGIILPTRDYTSLTLTVSKDNKAVVTAIDKLDTVVVSKEIALTAISFDEAAKGGICMGGGYVGGNYALNIDNAFSGYVDEMRVFTGKALTKAEILKNYNHMLAGTEDGLFAYWPVDEGISGQTYAYDYSKTSGVANGNHARFGGVKTAVTSTVVPESTQLALFGYTDAQGNFVVRGVPFSGDGTNYMVVPTLGVHEFSPQYSSRYVSSSSLVHSGVDFEDVSSFPVTGYVLYDGTDYPVEGCNFYVDGNICSKDGEVIASAEDGSYTISVPIGDHFIEVKKNGHVFASEGRYPADPNATGERLTFVQPVKNLEFRDQTLVNFSGRVVGGSTEGDKPVGFGQSVNNIGITELVLTPNIDKYRLNVVKELSGTTYSYQSNPETVDVRSATTNINSRSWRGAGELCKKIYILTDSLTGEFSAMVPPLNYKVESMTVRATGNSVGDATTVDLSNPQMEYTDSLVADDGEMMSYTYNYGMKKTYHSEPSFVVTQADNADGAFGLSEYQIEDANGKLDIKDIYSVAEDGTVNYKYGGAIFESLDSYTFKIEAFEEYVNHDVKGSPVSYHVPLEGLEVTVSNELSSEQSVYVDEGAAGKPAGSIAEMKDNTLTLDSLGKATYVWKAGLPNITAPYSRTISMFYEIEDRTYGWSGNGMPGIILGSLSTGNNFVTAGPDLVDMILRDPPGTGSSAEWTSGTISSSFTSAAGVWSIDWEQMWTMKLGVEATTVTGFPAVGVINDIKSENDLVLGINEQIYGEAGSTWRKTMTTTRAISTSSAPEYVGANGDVFIGSATNMIYGKARDVNFRRVGTGNEVELGLKDVMTTGLSYTTVFNYTANYIENVLIPNLRSIRNGLLQTVDNISGYKNTTGRPVYLTNLLPDDPKFGSDNYDKSVWGSAATPTPNPVGPSYTMVVPNEEESFADSVAWCNTQIANWEKYLALNEQEKVRAYENRQEYLKQNLSFDSGSSITMTEETEESHGSTYDVNAVISGIFSKSFGVSYNTTGVIFELHSTIGAGTHVTNENETTEFASYSYTLAEEGDDDALTVDVFNYGAYSPIFRTRGGQTSGPYEGEVKTKYYRPGTTIMEATMQIEVPQITVDVPTVSNVPTGQAANYTLRLTNASEIDEDVYYKLLVIDESNPDGAKITIDGQPLTDNRIIKIPAGETITKALQLTQTNLGVLEYNNIGVVLASQSQYDPTSTWDQIADTVYISAQFVPSSSAVTMKLDHTTLNTMLGDEPVLNISLSQFDRNYNNLKAFRLQYCKQGDLDWTTFHEYVLNEKDKTQNNEYLPDQATVSYKFPMKAYSDATYRFRVLSVATYGTDEVYNQSEEIDVVKDMSRPLPLGLPQPSDGILNAGDEISIQFNEDIQKGLLTNMGNFLVTGVLNGATIMHDVALDMVTDESSAATEADIVLNNHDFSIDAWINVATQGTIVSHGDGATKLEIGTDAQGHLTMSIGENTYTSNNAMPRNKWLYLTTSYKAGAQPILNAAYAQDDQTVTLFDDVPVSAYSGQGKLKIGSSGAKGAIHELTLWDEAHDLVTALLDKQRSKKPSTPHLIGYWKMNEGEGTLITDYARNRHMKMTAEAWKLENENKAIDLDGTSHLDIVTGAIPPLSSDNCAIELWMRAGEQKGEAELFQSGEVELWIDGGGKLQLTSLGSTYAASQTSVLDNAWHHVALNILRTGHATVYVDGKRTLSTSASNVGQTASDRLIIGARRSAGTDTKYAYDRLLKGTVDEVRLWNATLTADLIKERSKVRLSGEEGGLVAYYPFETKRLDDNNQVVTEGTAKDLRSDNIATYESATGFKYTDESPALRAARTETNVGFSFTASDNKVVINLTETPADIEGCTLHFQVANVLDLNGNQLRPVTWSAFVNCNELTWDNPTITINKKVGEKGSVDATFTNNGGSQQIWSISGLPTWLTASVEDGVAEALTTTTVGFDISEGLAIGTYEETVYLTGNDNTPSALTIKLVVTGDVPQWSVNPADYENSMNLIGTLSILGQPTDDAQDLVAVFIDGECRGVAHPTYNARYDNYFVQLDIYGNTEDAGKPVVFYAYDNSTGTKYPQLSTSQEIVFRDNQVYGTFAAPVVLNADDLIEQSRDLVQGWNWVSFYVHADEMGVENIFSPIAASTDVVKNQTEFGTFENGQFFGKAFETDNRSMYRVHTTAPQTLNVIGRRLTAEQRTITLQLDWNWIAYNAMQTASVGDALAGINPQDGDLIKGQKGFALYDGYEWNGSLKALTPGQGYMLRSSTTEERTFEYPTMAAAPAYAASKAMQRETGVFSPIDYHKYPGNMCIVASIKWEGAPAVGYEVGVFDDSNCRCVEITDEEGYAYFTVPGDEKQTLRFMMVRGDEMHLADVTVTYVEDALIGTHSSPLILSFDTSTNSIGGISDGIGDDTQWFTVDGARMPGKPAEPGVYLCRTYDKKTQTVKTRKVVIK
ncbi:MAG: LamG-like jellyroll fold domain-containing protein [Prevotella sp.]